MIRTRWALATLLAACLVGACSDDDPEPDIADPTSSASSTSATVSPSPSESATESTDPVAVVRAWVDARNDALASGDTTRLRSATDPKCRSCMSLITSIEDVYEAGGSYDTKGWEVKSAKARDQGGSRPAVDAALVFAGGRTIDHAGAEPIAYGPENHIMIFKMHVVDGQTLIDFVGFIS